METAERTEIMEEKERRFDALAQELYRDHQRIITPIYPWIVVRILPKEQTFGTILLPEKQNKIFYEGIVLATWKPFQRHYTGTLKFAEETEALGDEVRVVNKLVWMQSSVNVGDRVLFMHFEGQPVPYFDELHYRMIHEVETHPNGGIWGTIDLDEDRGLREKLDKLFKDKTSRTISGK